MRHRPSVRVIGRAGMIRLIMLAALAGTAIVVTVTVGVPDLTQLRAHFGGGGLLGALTFSGLYAAVTLSPLPKTVFTLAAGALFGVFLGLLVVVLGAMIGAVVAFYLGRWLGRDGVQRLTRIRAERFDAQLAEHGLWAVLVLRLIPLVPFTALNYLAGLTALRLRDFLIGTVIGMIPATTASITLGAYGSQPTSWPFLAAAAALLLLSGVGMFLAARRRRRVRSAPPENTEPLQVPVNERASGGAPYAGPR